MTLFSEPESSELAGAGSIQRLTRAAEEFARARDWCQFHDPKNLAMALASEAGELLSILRWVGNSDVDVYLSVSTHRAALKDEIGDVGICLLLLCARAGVDLGSAVMEKIEKNATKYPLDASRACAEPPDGA